MSRPCKHASCLAALTMSLLGGDVARAAEVEHVFLLVIDGVRAPEGFVFAGGPALSVDGETVEAAPGYEGDEAWSELTDTIPTDVGHITLTLPVTAPDYITDPLPFQVGLGHSAAFDYTHVDGDLTVRSTGGGCGCSAVGGPAAAGLLLPGLFGVTCAVRARMRSPLDRWTGRN